MAVLDWADERESMRQDPCSKAGAEKLKERIEAYWLEHGFAKPNLELRAAGFIAAMRSARTDIRSDMKNGMPARALSSQEHAP